MPPPGRVGEGQGEGDSVEYGVPEVMFKDPVGEGLRLPLVDRVVVRHTDIESVTDTVGVGSMVVARGLGDRVPLTVGEEKAVVGKPDWVTVRLVDPVGDTLWPAVNAGSWRRVKMGRSRDRTLAGEGIW